MDQRLRQYERLKHEQPERWLKELIRAGKLGPTNQAVFAMLGHQPMVNILGGGLPIVDSRHYWFKHKWYTEEQVQKVGMMAEYFGTEYRPCVHRIHFFAQKTIWMLRVLKRVSGISERKELEEWLVTLDHRQQLLGALLQAL